MKVLTGQQDAYLSPSSMQAGNTTAANPALAMTAPGSESVLPVAERLDVLPQPRWTNATPIPVSHPGMQERAPVQAARDGSGPGWTNAHDIPKTGNGWTETS